MNFMVRQWSTILASVAVLFALTACQKRFEFQEEVQLADGEVINAIREVRSESLGEIGGPGGWEAAYMSFKVLEPSSASRLPKWESTMGLIPIVFDRDPINKEWTLLATFYTCEAWYRLGRPKKSPYAEFKIRDGQWKGIEFSKDWVGRRANVLTSIKGSGENKLVTLHEKRKRMSNLKTARKYKFIVDNWTTGC